MNDYEKQYFNTLLQIATERFVERIIQRNEGAKNALDNLRKDPYGEGVWIDKFVNAFFEEFLLDNPAGSSFILQALANRVCHFQYTTLENMTVGNVLENMAKELFEQLLNQKVEEALEQNLAFGG